MSTKKISKFRDPVNLPKMVRVYEKTVDSVGYNKETKALYVKWRGGKTSIYTQVRPVKARIIRPVKARIIMNSNIVADALRFASFACHMFL